MNKASPKQLIALGILGIVLVGAIVRAVFMSPGGTTPDTESPRPRPAAQNDAAASTQGAANSTDTPAASGVDDAKQMIDIEELRASLKTDIFDYQQYRLERDVFRPLVGDDSRAPLIVKGNEGEGEPQREMLQQIADSMALTGIIWSDKRPMAIINQQVVYPGYAFTDGIVVESIEEARVLLRVGDTVVALDMPEESFGDNNAFVGLLIPE